MEEFTQRKINTNDIDAALRIVKDAQSFNEARKFFEDDSPKKYEFQDYESSFDGFTCVYKNSLEPEEIEYNPEVVERPIGYKKDARKKTGKFLKGMVITLAFAAGISSTIGVNHLIDNNMLHDEKASIGYIYAGAYTHYPQKYLNPDLYEYSYDGMANSILSGKTYDVDTRIYGCYVGMQDYNKVGYMNTLFNVMQNKISQTEYSADVVEACSYPSFEEYLAAKNLTLEEYVSLMDKIVLAYAKEKNNNKDVSELLNELNNPELKEQSEVEKLLNEFKDYGGRNGRS